jgi:hypothetical protein
MPAIGRIGQQTKCARSRRTVGVLGTTVRGLYGAEKNEPSAHAPLNSWDTAADVPLAGLYPRGHSPMEPEK